MQTETKLVRLWVPEGAQGWRLLKETGTKWRQVVRPEATGVALALQLEPGLYRVWMKGRSYKFEVPNGGRP